jgi:diaminopimelate epimerase
VIPVGREFFKMSGSGNDFVMVDARTEPPGELATPQVVQTICARGTGVGADGIVFLENSTAAPIRLTYLNADGSRADLCGNATLCTARLATELGVVKGDRFTIETDSGVVAARMVGGLPEIDLQPVRDVSVEALGIDKVDGELRIGFALVGVPHLVILTPDVRTVDVVGRGRPLRRHPTLPAGANVNFVSPAGENRWLMRTYERGVEAETLACGSGAVASAILTTAWGRSSGPISIETRSGRRLGVRLTEQAGVWSPSLSGEARIVYRGRIGEI